MSLSNLLIEVLRSLKRPSSYSCSNDFIKSFRSFKFVLDCLKLFKIFSLKFFSLMIFWALSLSSQKPSSTI